MGKISLCEKMAARLVFMIGKGRRTRTARNKNEVRDEEIIRKEDDGRRGKNRKE